MKYLPCFNYRETRLLIIFYAFDSFVREGESLVKEVLKLAFDQGLSRFAEDTGVRTGDVPVSVNETPFHADPSRRDRAEKIDGRRLRDTSVIDPVRRCEHGYRIAQREQDPSVRDLSEIGLFFSDLRFHDTVSFGVLHHIHPDPSVKRTFFQKSLYF